MIYFIIAIFGGIVGSTLNEKYGPKIIAYFGGAAIFLATIYLTTK